MAEARRSDQRIRPHAPSDSNRKTTTATPKRRTRRKRSGRKGTRTQCWLTKMVGLFSRCAAGGCKKRPVSSSCKYCEDHVCRLNVGSPHRCVNRKKAGETLCSSHLACAYSGCRSERQGRTIESRKKWKYCTDHGCQHNECPKLRREPMNRNRFCDEHACKTNKHCNRPQNGLGATMCPHHKCRDPNCVALVKGTHDPRDAAAKNFCDSHKRCQFDQCTNAVHILTVNPARKYCVQHFCDIKGVCDKQRATGPDATACEAHTCFRFRNSPSCSKIKDDPVNGTYCKDHECKNESCNRERLDALEWCNNHACMAYVERKENCLKEREGTPENFLYCKDHRKCSEPGCSERCGYVKNVIQTKCDKHLRNMCRMLGCEKDARNPAVAPAYCDDHTCAFGTCATPRSVGLFCQLHTCAQPSCLEPRIIANGPIKTASVALLSLSAGGGPVHNFSIPVGMYCIEHTCEARGCTNLGDATTGLCNVHCCKYPECHNKITDKDKNAAYCAMHKCARHGCNAARERDYGGGGGPGFCLAHGGDNDEDYWGAPPNVAGFGRSGGRRDMYPSLHW